MKNADMPISAIWTQEMNLGETAGPGLTKREHFAAMAMQGLLSGVNGDAELHDSGMEWLKDISEASIEFADALLAELERTS